MASPVSHAIYYSAHRLCRERDTLHAKVSHLNFHPLEFVSRYRDPQLQVGENYICLMMKRIKNDYSAHLELKGTGPG